MNKQKMIREYGILGIVIKSPDEIGECLEIDIDNLCPHSVRGNLEMWNTFNEQERITHHKMVTQDETFEFWCDYGEDNTLVHYRDTKGVHMVAN